MQWLDKKTKIGVQLSIKIEKNSKHFFLYYVFIYFREVQCEMSSATKKNSHVVDIVVGNEERENETAH